MDFITQVFLSNIMWISFAMGCDHVLMGGRAIKIPRLKYVLRFWAWISLLSVPVYITWFIVST